MLQAEEILILRCRGHLHIDIVILPGSVVVPVRLSVQVPIVHRIHLVTRGRLRVDQRINSGLFAVQGFAHLDRNGGITVLLVLRIQRHRLYVIFPGGNLVQELIPWLNSG